MDLTQLVRLKVTAPTKIDEAFYELIAAELASKQVKQGLWTKALADAEWEEQKAKSYYVKMRHAQLINEINELAKKQLARESGVDPIEEALQYGLSEDDVRYLVQPIKAIKYLEKYRKSQQQVLDAIAKRKLTSVMRNEVLWVSDRPI